MTETEARRVIAETLGIPLESVGVVLGAKLTIIAFLPSTEKKVGANERLRVQGALWEAGRRTSYDVGLVRFV